MAIKNLKLDTSLDELIFGEHNEGDTFQDINGDVVIVAETGFVTISMKCPSWCVLIHNSSEEGNEYTLDAPFTPCDITITVTPRT